MCATGANDKTCIVWDTGSGKPIQTVNDHNG